MRVTQLPVSYLCSNKPRLQDLLQLAARPQTIKELFPLVPSLPHRSSHKIHVPFAAFAQTTIYLLPTHGKPSFAAYTEFLTQTTSWHRLFLTQTSSWHRLFLKQPTSCHIFLLTQTIICHILLLTQTTICHISLLTHIVPHTNYHVPQALLPGAPPSNHRVGILGNCRRKQIVREKRLSFRKGNRTKRNMRKYDAWPIKKSIYRVNYQRIISF